MIPLGYYLQREKGVEVLYLAGNEEAKKLSGRVVEASLPTVECEEKDEEVQTMDSKSFIGRLFVGCFPSSPISQEIDSLTLLQARSLRLLKRIRPTHIGLYGDFNLGYDMPLIWAAKLLDIKSVVLPVIKSVPDFIAQSRIKIGGEFLARGSLLGKVVSFFFPHQVHFYKGEKCFFYHPRTVLALLFSRMLSPRPWIYGGGNSDYVFVTGENEKIFLESNMVRKSRIKVTGQYSHDAIYEQWSKREQARGDLYEEYELDKKQKLIVVALPQLAEHKLRDWEAHDEEVNFLLETLSNLSANVLISLHPKMAMERYKPLEKSFSVRIAEQRLSQLIASADLFVAGFESTVLWSILVKVPPVFLAYLQLGQDLSRYQSVTNVNKKAQLQDRLQEVLEKGGRREALKKEAPKMGMLDGKCGERIYEQLCRTEACS